jgi:hypothetical protein
MCLASRASSRAPAQSLSSARSRAWHGFLLSINCDAPQRRDKICPINVRRRAMSVA